MRTTLIGIAALILGSQVGCCSWCEKHCPHTGYAQAPPAAYCQPCQPVCCQPCAPVQGYAPAPGYAPAAGPAPGPNYINPQRTSQYPATSCGCP